MGSTENLPWPAGSWEVSLWCVPKKNVCKHRFGKELESFQCRCPSSSMESIESRPWHGHEHRTQQESSLCMFSALCPVQTSESHLHHRSRRQRRLCPSKGLQGAKKCHASQQQSCAAGCRDLWGFLRWSRWRFPEIGVFPRYHPFIDGIFREKVTIQRAWDSPMTVETPKETKETTIPQMDLRYWSHMDVAFYPGLSSISMCHGCYVKLKRLYGKYMTNKSHQLLSMSQQHFFQPTSRHQLTSADQVRVIPSFRPWRGRSLSTSTSHRFLPECGDLREEKDLGISG